MTEDLMAPAIALSKRLEEVAQSSADIPPAVSEDDANALVLHIGNLRRIADQVEAAAQRYAAEQRERVDRMLTFYGPALRKLAQERIGKKSPRRLLLPLGQLRLKKTPTRLVERTDDNADKDFRKWDYHHDFAWTRVRAMFKSLTRPQLNKLVDALDDELLPLLQYKIEPKKEEINAHFKKTGEVVPGFEVVEGQDELFVELAEPKEAPQDEPAAIEEGES